MEKIAKFEFVSLNEFQSHFDKDIKNIYDNLKLPKRATQYSAGYDFYAPYDFELKPNQSLIIPTGIKVKMDNNYFLLIAPRSGLGTKFRMQLDNTIGIIDADYYCSDNEGHIMVKISNNNFENKTLSIQQNQAFVQGIFLKYGITIDDDTLQTRNGGFGSTNKK